MPKTSTQLRQSRASEGNGHFEPEIGNSMAKLPARPDSSVIFSPWSLPERPAELI